MKLALFFTKGVSLKVWEKVGMLDREIKPYKELAKHFDEILFLTYGGKEDLRYQSFLPENIKILPNKLKIPSLIYSFLLPFLYQTELKKADIFKTNQIIGSWTAIIAKFLFRKKVIVRQGYQLSIFAQEKGIKPWKFLIVRFMERFTYKKADAIIVTSERDKKYVEEKYNISSEKINYIPNYIDTDLFKPLDIAKEKTICFVGRLEEQKNLFNLIKAISGLDIKLVIFGSGSLEVKLGSLAGSNVEFKENISNKDLPKELNKSKLFILPSLYEGCPKVLLEAMSCGLSCIGTNVEGIKEIIRHQENGYLCDIDSDSIKKAILEVLNNKELQEKIGRNARQTILENFKLEKTLEKEIKLLKSL